MKNLWNESENSGIKLLNRKEDERCMMTFSTQRGNIGNDIVAFCSESVVDNKTRGGYKKALSSDVCEKRIRSLT